MWRQFKQAGEVIERCFEKLLSLEKKKSLKSQFWARALLLYGSFPTFISNIKGILAN